MRSDERSPEQKRERLRQEELRKNPTGGVNDAFNRASTGGLVDLAGSLGWKGMGGLILVIIIGFIITSFFFR